MHRSNGSLTAADHSNGALTVKLTAMIPLTLDGVYQGPGCPDEDRRGGFERGGSPALHADRCPGRTQGVRMVVVGP